MAHGTGWAEEPHQHKRRNKKEEMVKMEIEVPAKLMTAFEEAVDMHNSNHPTATLTSEQMLFKLLQDFSIDTIHAGRMKTAHDSAEDELKELKKLTKLKGPKDI